MKGHVGKLLILGEVAVLVDAQSAIHDIRGQFELVEHSSYNISGIIFLTETAWTRVSTHHQPFKKEGKGQV